MQITLGKRRKNDGNNSITSKKISTEETYHPTEASKPELKIGEAGVGDFVALRLVKYEDEIPQIAKVVRKDGFDVTVEWWVGTYSNLWTEWKEKKQVVKETVPRNAIIMKVQLTKSRRLPTALIQKLKDAYNSIELI